MRNRVIVTGLVAGLAGAASADVRDVQIQEINTSTQIVKLHNFGTSAQSLDMYAMCTSDSNQSLRYTQVGTLAGKIIPAGGDFYLHWLDDAPPGEDNRVNITDLGGDSARPLSNAPFGMCVYWDVPFFAPENMADYVQWTDDLDNPGNGTADNRALTAVQGNLWTAVDAWVITEPGTTTITLIDPLGQELHGPGDYEISSGTGKCIADIDGSGAADFGDILAILAAWGDAGGPADIDMSGFVDFGDLLVVLGAWGPCA